MVELINIYKSKYSPDHKQLIIGSENYSGKENT